MVKTAMKLSYLVRSGFIRPSIQKVILIFLPASRPTHPPCPRSRLDGPDDPWCVAPLAPYTRLILMPTSSSATPRSHRDWDRDRIPAIRGASIRPRFSFPDIVPHDSLEALLALQRRASLSPRSLFPTLFAESPLQLLDLTCSRMQQRNRT
jgi:hypothetical protein